MEKIQASDGLFCLELEIYIIQKEDIKTHWELSENLWEYSGQIYVKSKEIPKVRKVEHNNYEMSVDGVVINFDEEIKFIEKVGC